MNWYDFLLGTPGGIQQVSPYSEQQQQAMSQIMPYSLYGLQNPQQGFEPMAQQARTQFMQTTIPSLAERFSSMGSNAMSSPAFLSQLGQAGAGLEQNLAAMGSQYGLQNRSQLMSLLGMGLSPQYQNYQVKAQPGLFQQMMPAMGRIGATALGAGMTGGFGAVMPAIGQLLSLL